MSGRKGRSGRPRLPTSVKRERGTLRADREERRAKTDPVPSWTPHRPKIPHWLSGSARTCWSRLAPLLDAAGRLTEVDRELLAAYCCAWETLTKARAEVAKGGLTVTGPGGGTFAHPAARLVLQASTTLRQLGAELGITPLARGRVHAAGRVERPDGATPALPSDGAEKRRAAARAILTEAVSLSARVRGPAVGADESA